MGTLYIKKNANFDLIKCRPLELNLKTHAANECRHPDWVSRLKKLFAFFFICHTLIVKLSYHFPPMKAKGLAETLGFYLLYFTSSNKNFEPEQRFINIMNQPGDRSIFKININLQIE